MDNGKRRMYLAFEIAALATLAPSPALRFDGRPVTLYGLSIAAAALAAILFFEKMRLDQMKKRFPSDDPIGVIFRVNALELALWCIPAALLGARALYVALRLSYYFMDAGVLHIVYLWEGGFLLWGAVLGAAAAAIGLARKKKANHLELLDQMTAPGLLMIALSRLAECFAGEGLGSWVENPVFARFPFAVRNAYGEWQLAVFLFEALAALLIMAAVLRIKADGETRIAFALVLYAGAQVVLESLRMDSCLRIGFVRVSQVISAAVILAVTGVRAYRAGGRKQAIGRCAAVLMGTALIGGMEWALDKTQVPNILIYGIMAFVCVFMAGNALCIRKEENR